MKITSDSGDKLWW